MELTLQKDYRGDIEFIWFCFGGIRQISVSYIRKGLVIFNEKLSPIVLYDSLGVVVGL